MVMNIVIVDDHEIFRKGLKVVLSRLHYITHIWEAENGEQFLSMLKKHSPDIALLDIEMPGINGIEATQKALDIQPELKIIALTMFNDDKYIEEMLEAGARGFLLKNVTKQILDKAIQTVAAGNNYFSDELMNFFAKRLTSETKHDNRKPDFTPREFEILQLICEGFNNKHISEKLHISERTVIGHKSNLLLKTDCKSTAEMIAHTIKNQWIKINT
jgi:DNA-binding NarL/FixJ family response regulator